MASTADIRNGVVLSIDGQLWSIVEFQHVKPGKGGAFVRTKMKNVVSGKIIDKTFNAGAKVDVQTVDRSDYQYLYNDGDSFVFMDQRDYDQINVPTAVVGDASRFMLENMTVTIAMHDGLPLYVELPPSITLEDHVHRARPAGRPLQRGDEAGDGGDGRRDPGAAVPQRGDQGQGRHPLRRLPRPRERLR